MLASQSRGREPILYLSRGGLQRWRGVRSLPSSWDCVWLRTSTGATLVRPAGLPPAHRFRRSDADVRTPDLAEVTKLIMEGTNKFRKEEGRGELKSQEQLVATARDFARYLAKNEKLSHEADGSDPRERAKKHDYHPCIVAENIAYQYNSEGFQSEELARQFLDGWKKSPGHRKNLLDPYLLEAGMAVARSKESSKYYAVQVFGRPETAVHRVFHRQPDQCHHRVRDRGAKNNH